MPRKGQSSSPLCCLICHAESNSFGIGTHIWRIHGKGKGFNPFSKSLCHKAWNKGLTKSDPRVALNAARASKTLSGRKRKPHTNEFRLFLSELMKKKHKEGKAHNIGECRKRKEPSWPEAFFIKVIQNEFSDKNYTYEYWIKPFSIDFAWLEKKKAIEIDGEQHIYNPEQVERDKRKNELLKKEGWLLLRIAWKDLFHNTKHVIEQANNFIGEYPSGSRGLTVNQES